MTDVAVTWIAFTCTWPAAYIAIAPRLSFTFTPAWAFIRSTACRPN